MMIHHQREEEGRVGVLGVVEGSGVVVERAAVEVELDRAIMIMIMIKKIDRRATATSAFHHH